MGVGMKKLNSVIEVEGYADCTRDLILAAKG
jgi:hypothetical protein